MCAHSGSTSCASLPHRRACSPVGPCAGTATVFESCSYPGNDRGAARLFGLSGLSRQACSAPASAASAPASSPASSAAATDAARSARGGSPGLGFPVPASAAGEPARTPRPPRGVPGWPPAGVRVARGLPGAPARKGAVGGRGPAADVRAGGLAEGRKRLGPPGGARGAGGGASCTSPAFTGPGSGAVFANKAVVLRPKG